MFIISHPQNFFQIWVYGNSFESFLIAIINPNKQALEHWAELTGITGDFATLCENPKAKEYILGELTKIGKEKKVTWPNSSFILLGRYYLYHVRMFFFVS